MRRVDQLVFDLDGTLSDPSVGITRSLNHALEESGRPARRSDELCAYIGVPLDETFRRLAPGVSEGQVHDLVAAYRRRYAENGYAENVLYPGVASALARLASGGVRMGVCTSKRQDFAERILEMFALRACFAFVSGADVGVRKEAQLRGLLDTGVVHDRATMIGDRASDVHAARASGLRPIGVLWGFGSVDELTSAGANRLLTSPHELVDLAEGVERA